MELKYELKDFEKGRIISKFGLEHEGQTRLYLSNRAFIRMEKYVPKDTGNLATTVTVRPGSVTYEQNYAHIQYISNNGKKAPRGKYWDRRMWSAEGDKLTKEVERYMKHLKATKG